MVTQSYLDLDAVGFRWSWSSRPHSAASLSIKMHGIFGSHQSASASGGGADRIVAFNPKRVLYEVYGPSETVGSISYLDENANPIRADFTTLPWSVQVSTTLPSMFANVVAQGNSDNIGCRITVNGQLREDRSSTGHDGTGILPGEGRMSTRHAARPAIARLIRLLAIPIILIWVALMMVTNAALPQLEIVGHDHLVSLSPPDAPASVAMKRLGQQFEQFDSDSIAMVVLEGDQPLGDEAHRYYDNLVRELERDTEHVRHVQNYWGDLITAAGSQSTDAKGAYVMVNLVGDVGSTASIESVDAVRQIVAESKPPAGVKAYVTGQAPLSTDNTEAGEKSLVMITVITLVAITIMLLIVYRSITTALFDALCGRHRNVRCPRHRRSGRELRRARTIDLRHRVVDFVGYCRGHRLRDLPGRPLSGGATVWPEREDAYYTAFHGVAHVILGSGLTVAGAMVCLHFTRLNYFKSMGIPSAIALSVVVVAALTLAPAMLAVGSRFGVFEPRRVIKTRGWRRVGTVVVRWPAQTLVAATALALVGLLALPGYTTSYNDRHYIPADLPSNVGYAAAERHFTAARMNPDILLVEAGRDLRNAADMIVLDRIAKKIFEVPGIARVQSITRPLGDPIAHSSIPFQVSLQTGHVAGEHAVPQGPLWPTCCG